MARETKQDRIVRSMFDQVSEHTHELKALVANSATKELDVERWAQSLIRSCLAYTASNGYTIRAQEARGRMRPDLVVCKNDKPVFVIEVKRLGFELGKADFRSGKAQLTEYLRDFPDVRWGFLTNGIEWKLFDFSAKDSRGTEVISPDLRNEAGEVDLSKKGVEETCWELFDLHETCFSDNTWDELYREASAFSPDSISRAILSADVIKVISKVIRGEHEFKANTEALFDRVVEVVTMGLDDVDSGWNETKMLELNKYVKAQKKATGRKRRSARRSGEEQDAIAPAEQAGAPATTDVAAVASAIAAPAGQAGNGSGENVA